MDNRNERLLDIYQEPKVKSGMENDDEPTAQDIADDEIMAAAIDEVLADKDMYASVFPDGLPDDEGGNT